MYEGALFYTESFTYDGNGNLKTQTARNGGVTLYEYDKNNRLTHETLPVTSRNSLNALVAVRNYREYDARGNVIKTIEAMDHPEKRTTVYGFDKLNRQFKETGDAITTFDPVTKADVVVTPVKERKFDFRGNMIEEINVRGGRTLYFYDKGNRNTGVIDSGGTYTRNSYNPVGLKSEQVVYANPVAVVGGGAVPAGTAPVLLAAGAPLPAKGAYVYLDAARDRTTSYTYDGAGRLKTTLIKSISTASYIPGTPPAYNIAPVDIRTENFYDATGNLVKVIDANGNVTRSYYNKAGQLTAQLDAMRYLIVYARDAFGNVDTQSAYATAIGGAIIVDDSTTLAQISFSTRADDRITKFAYDRIGRTLSESRLNVAYGTVNSTTGAITELVGAATTSYKYDGLSNVSQKTDANGAVTDWGYDKLGRKILEQQASFTDYRGQIVRSTTAIEYDGLDNVKRELVRGENNSAETDDRITEYQYGAGGFLIGQTDPERAQLNYRIDAAGNITRKTLEDRKSGDTTFVDDITIYWYDAMGRETRHTDQATGTVSETRYNGFGEITGKRTNPVTGSIEWAESADYDQAGRAWRSNVGDGITKIYVYDKNGNATLRLDHPAINLGDTNDRKWTLKELTVLEGTNRFFSTYDARNQLTGTYEPAMVGGHNIITVAETLSQQQGTSFENIEQSVLMGIPSGLTNATAAGQPKATGSVAITRAQTMSAKLTDHYNITNSYFNNRLTYTEAQHTLTLNLPDTSVYGASSLRIFIELQSTGDLGGFSGSYNVALGSPSATFTFSEHMERDGPVVYPTQRTLSFKLVAETPRGPVPIASHTWQRPTPTAGTFVADVTVPTTGNTLHFEQAAVIDRMVLMTRVSGTTSGWTIHNVPKAYSGGIVEAGKFAFDWSALPRGSYAFRYVGFDQNSQIHNSQEGTMVLSDSTPAISQTSHSIGGAGRAFVDANGAFVFNELGGTAIRLTLRYRAAGTQNAWATQTLLPSEIGGAVMPGWFTFMPPGLTGSFDYEIEATNVDNVTINKSRSTFTMGPPRAINEPAGALIQTVPTATISAGITSPTPLSAILVRTTSVAQIWGQGPVIYRASAPENTLTLVLPETSAWGDGNVRVQASIAASGSASSSYSGFNGTFEYASTQGTVQISMPQTATGGGGAQIAAYSYSIYKKTPNGEILLASHSGTTGTGSWTMVGNVTVTKSETASTVKTADSLLTFAVSPNGGAGPARVMLEYRRDGDGTQGWTVALLDQQYINNAIAANRFQFRWDNFAPGGYTYRVTALDSAGNVIGSRTGWTELKTDTPSRVSLDAPIMIGGNGRVFMDSSGRLNFSEQGTNTDKLTIRYRSRGSSTLWGPRIDLPREWINGFIPGWFIAVPPSGGGNDLEYVIEARDPQGKLINKTAGTFFKGLANSVTDLVSYSEPPGVTRFQTQPANAAIMKLSYRPAGIGEYTQVNLSTVVPGIFDWVSGNVFSSDTINMQYDFKYEVVDGNGVLVNKAHGVLMLGAAPALVSSTQDSIPNLASFKLPSGNPIAATATSMLLQYRINGSQNAFKVEEIKFPVNGVFVWNATDVIAAGQPGVVDYSYKLLNGSTLLKDQDGNPIEIGGTLHFGPTAAPSTLRWLEGSFVKLDEMIVRTQLTNAFGEVISETNARTFTTTSRYNTLGKLITKEDPSVWITLSNGFKHIVSPRTTYYYDRMGRMLGTRDANGNLGSQALIGPGAYVATEYHADGGTKQSRYDVFGDLRYIIDFGERNLRTDYSYDKNGRLILIQRPLRADNTRSEVHMTYDQAGNRISQAETPDALALLTSYTSKTYFDSMGRVSEVRSAAGRSSTYAYVWDNAIKSTGGRVTGGWRKTIVDPMGRSSIDEIDAYGRTTRHTDLGGHIFTYAFNYAGWLIGQTGTTGQNIVYTYFKNGYVQSVRDIALNTESQYEYDRAGNRTYESYSRMVNGKAEPLQNSSVLYDAANRVTRIRDVRGDISYEYDAVGNRRRVHSLYHDGVQGDWQTQDYWYSYDEMNRFTITMGSLSSVNGTPGANASDTSVKIVLGKTGGESVALKYNQASQRIRAVAARDGHREDYTYGVEGYLEVTYSNANDSDQGAMLSQRVNDRLGRTTGYYEYNAQGVQTSERLTKYNADGRQMSQTGTDGEVTYQYYSKRSPGGDDSLEGISSNGVGELALVRSVKDGTTITNYTTYEYWDEAKQRNLTTTGKTPYDTFTEWKPGTSSFKYDLNGHLSSATDAGKDSSTGTPLLDRDNVEYKYISNAQGLVLRREQYKANNVGMLHRYMYLNGVMVGDVGNDGDAHLDYAQTLAQVPVDRETMYRNWRPISSADFDQNYQPINRTYPAATGSTYTAKEGDTLYAVAGAVWGDVSMWYLIADANGLTGDTVLKAGQSLTIPNMVTNIHNNSGTFRPYNAGAIIGDVSPTLPDAPPPPPPPKGCGTLGMIIVVVIAAVVAFYAGAAATGLLEGVMSAAMATAAGGVVGAAAGSIVSQGAAVMMGMQEKIDWRAVKTSALTAAILPNMGGFKDAAANGFGMIANAAVRNIVGQGIGKLTGQLEHFTWRSVAVSAFTAPMVAVIKNDMMNTSWGQDNVDLAMVAGNAASSIVSGTVRVAISGGRLSWGSIAVDAIGGYVSDRLAYKPPNPYTIGRPSQSTGIKFKDGGLDSLSLYARSVPPGVTVNPESHAHEDDDSSAVSSSNGYSVAAAVKVSQQAVPMMALPPLNSSVNLIRERTSAGAFLSSGALHNAVIDKEKAFDYETSGGDNIRIRHHYKLSSFEKWQSLQDEAPLETTDEAQYNANGEFTHYETVTKKRAVPIPYGMAISQATQGLATATVGIADKVASGVINQSVRIAGGFFSVLPAAFGSVDKAVATQNWFGRTFKYTARSKGAQGIDRLVQPVAAAIVNKVITPMTNYSESKIGIGATTVIKSSAQAGLEIWGTVTGTRSVFGALDAPTVRGLSMPTSRTGCFVAGTQVWTSNGLKPIQDIRIGELVLSQPETTGERAFRRVDNVFTYLEKSIYRTTYQTDDGRVESIEATPNHPFFVKDIGWIAVEFLEVGQVLELHEGTSARVIEVVDTGMLETVHNIEVNGFHTYYVGEVGVWVHNVNCADVRWMAETELSGPYSLISERPSAPLSRRTESTNIDRPGQGGANSATAKLGIIESRFGGASREVGFVVESGTGKILTIGRQPYNQSYDGFKFTPEQWAIAEGNWVTHNHPSGLTLGIQDLASAVANNARGIRASTPTGTFELSFDQSFAKAYRGDPGATFGFLQAETNTIGRGIMADVRSGTLTVPQGVTGLQKNGFMANEMWIRYADQTPGLHYTFTPRKSP